MKVVGIEIAGTDLRWLSLNGKKSAGITEFLKLNTLRFPVSHAAPVENFVELKKLVIDNLRPFSVDRVAIIKAARGASVQRAKCEMMVQLACLELNIPCCLVAIATVNAAGKRKIAESTGSNFAAAFNRGAPLAPGYLERAAYCAWTALP